MSEAKTERVSKSARPSQSPAVTALPEGEPRGRTSLIACLHKKWSVSAPIRSIHCFTTTHERPRRFDVLRFVREKVLDGAAGGVLLCPFFAAADALAHDRAVEGDLHGKLSVLPRILRTYP